MRADSTLVGGRRTQFGRILHTRNKSVALLFIKEYRLLFLLHVYPRVLTKRLICGKQPYTV